MVFTGSAPKHNSGCSEKQPLLEQLRAAGGPGSSLTQELGQPLAHPTTVWDLTFPPLQQLTCHSFYLPLKAPPNKPTHPEVTMHKIEFVEGSLGERGGLLSRTPQQRL